LAVGGIVLEPGHKDRGEMYLFPTPAVKRLSAEGRKEFAITIDKGLRDFLDRHGIQKMTARAEPQHERWIERLGLVKTGQVEPDEQSGVLLSGYSWERGQPAAAPAPAPAVD